jgi:hypothetical protein
MAFGIWYDDKGEVHVMDNKGRKLPLIDATAKAREVLSGKFKDELLTALVDRLDVNDIIGFIADADQNFLPGVVAEDGKQD